MSHRRGYVPYGLYIDEVLTMRRGGVDYYYHADEMHNVVKLTDNAGAILEAYDYADYGQPEFYDATGNELTGTAYANPYLFTGREWDEELGYYYYRNRYMDPAQGRFASRDPLGLWGDPLNLGNGYNYAGSNPWSLVDPFGLAAGGNGNGVLEDWGYAFPDPHDSRYSPYMRDLLLGQFHEALHDQIIWTANGIGIIPGPSGTLADAIVAIETGDYMILVEGLGGEVIGEVIGGFRKFSRAQVAADAQKRGVRVPKIACFPAGTLVMLADGSAKPIETIREGDLVLADNPEDETTTSQFKVSAIFRSYTLRLIRVAVDHDGDDEADGEFRATGEHPVWTQNRGWQIAEALGPGDVLQDANQRGVTVVRTWEEETESASYNLTVEGVNTFFIVVDGVSILVHNTENDIVPYGRKTSPNKNHHGVMNAWLEANLAGQLDVNGNPAYQGRKEWRFPTLELSPDAHARATAYESEWRANYRHQNGVKRIDWAKVTPREVQEVSVGALDAAGVPKRTQEEYFGKVNKWLYEKFCP